MWTTPIFDRTNSDVTYLKSLYAKFGVGGFDGFTLEEKAYWIDNTVKGSLNSEDLNRIENNISYLSSQLNTYGYTNTITEKEVLWTKSDMFYLTDLDRIRQNIMNICEAYPVLPTITFPTLLDSSLDYIKVNELEELLYRTNELLETLISSFRMCGTFYCGENNAYL